LKASLAAVLLSLGDYGYQLRFSRQTKGVQYGKVQCLWTPAGALCGIAGKRSISHQNFLYFDKRKRLKRECQSKGHSISLQVVVAKIMFNIIPA